MTLGRPISTGSAASVATQYEGVLDGIWSRANRMTAHGPGVRGRGGGHCPQIGAARWIRAWYLAPGRPVPVQQEGVAGIAVVTSYSPRIVGRYGGHAVEVVEIAAIGAWYPMPRGSVPVPDHVSVAREGMAHGPGA